MKHINKFQMAIIVFTCVFLFSVCALAANFNATLDLGDGTNVSTDVINGSVGATVAVPVKLTKTGGEVGGVAFTLEYDAAKLEFVAVEEIDTAGAQEAVDPVAKGYCNASSCQDPYTTGNVAKSALFFQANNQSGKVLIAAAAAQAVADGNLFNVKFKLKASGESSVNIVQTKLPQNTSAGYDDAENPIDEVVGMPSLTPVGGKYPVEDTFTATLTGVKLDIEQPTIPVGDADGDGDITPQDAVDVFYLSLKPSDQLSAEEKRRADFNGDGTVTPQDAVDIFYESLK